MTPKEAFYSVGTDEGRALTWKLWRLPPGARFFVATLEQLVEVEVIGRAQTSARGESLAVSVAGEPALLLLYRSASAGYYDRNPHESFPGCDLDLDFEGASAQLLELDSVDDDQLRLKWCADSRADE